MTTMDDTEAIPRSVALAAEISESIESRGVWATMNAVKDRLSSADASDELPLRGFLEILRTVAVRDLLAHPKGLAAVPRLSSDFLSNFDRFNLSAQEGYLVSLIDGRLTIQKLLLLSPLDHFTTLFVLARLANQGAIEVPK